MEVNINNWSQIIIEYYTTTITALKNFIAQPVQGSVYILSRVPRKETIDIVGQTLIALGHCHLHFCVHRDLKPENLLMTAGAIVIKLFSSVNYRFIKNKLERLSLASSSSLV
jgi:serine/threonine protein kinase